MIADWTIPFNLTSSLYSSTVLPINQLITGTGYYLLRQDGCALRNAVREQKNDISQADGATLHRRFVGGMEMDLVFQFWQTETQIACDALQQTMLDTLMGYLYALINAGDNQGRISWTPDGKDPRMLDDLRLLTYPVVTSLPNALGIELAVTVDCALPYEEDLSASSQTFSGGVDTITNAGNRPAYPVFRIFSGNFTLFNQTTGYLFSLDDSQPGCPTVGGGDYVEIDTFRNTAYLNGNQANMKPGIKMNITDFFLLEPGDNALFLDGGGGGDSIEWNNAWA